GGKPKGVVVEREGPTGAILTTTRVKLDSELETRLLSIPVTDTAAQTKAVMFALAAGDAKAVTINHEWLELQRVIEQGAGCEVTIPFAHALAQAIPPAATRLRRDFATLLALTRAHALLHRASRERDDRDRTIASIDDYEVVWELVGDLVSEGVGR